MTKSDFVIILGDFGGIWGNTKEEKYWLKWLDEKPFTTLFIDGNHENFSLLNTYPVVDFYGGKAHKIGNRIYHLMRGYVFNLCGKKFFTFGGASSHDISDGILDPKDPDIAVKCRELRKRNAFFRIRNISWWEEELPNETEMSRGRDSLKEVNNEVDFVLTHCAPQEVASLLGFHESDKLTRYFNELILDGLKFTKWYFGHYHDNKAIMGKFIMLYEQIIRIL